MKRNSRRRVKQRRADALARLLTRDMTSKPGVFDASQAEINILKHRIQHEHPATSSNAGKRRVRKEEAED